MIEHGFIMPAAVMAGNVARYFRQWTDKVIIMIIVGYQFHNGNWK
jgi:hypothetical protein